FGAEALKILNSDSHCSIDFGIEAFDKVFFRKADLQTLDSFVEVGRKFGYGLRKRGGVIFVQSRDEVHQQCCVLYVFCERSNLVKRRSKRYQAEARDSPIGRL